MKRDRALDALSAGTRLPHCACPAPVLLSPLFCMALPYIEFLMQRRRLTVCRSVSSCAVIRLASLCVVACRCVSSCGVCHLSSCVAVCHRVVACRPVPRLRAAAAGHGSLGHNAEEPQLAVVARRETANAASLRNAHTRVSGVRSCLHAFPSWCCHRVRCCSLCDGCTIVDVTAWICVCVCVTWCGRPAT
jgi:hypothetical protein